MFFEKKQMTDKDMQAIMDHDRAMFNKFFNTGYFILDNRQPRCEEGRSLLAIVCTPKERAVFVETNVGGVSTIKAVKFTADMKPGFLVTYSQLPDDRASAWMPANFPDIESAKADFERLSLTKERYHVRACRSVEEPNRFLAALDCFLVSEVDSDINNAYAKVFHCPPKFIETDQNATQTCESKSTRWCSIMGSFKKPLQSA